MPKFKTDVCVIGAGSGGLSVAAGAVQMGADVVLIEKHKMGGDCLNYGCVPSKALLAAAKTAHNMTNTDKFGVKSVTPEINFGAVKDHVADVIAQIEPHDSVERFEGLGVNVLLGEGSFVDDKTVQVGETTVTAKYFVIATGSRPGIPPIPGLDSVDYFTNETIFDQRERPDHLIIIGGGPIGLEMAQAHRRLGSEVSVIDMASILPKDEPESVEILRGVLKTENITLHENTGIERIEKTDAGVSVITSNGPIEGSHLLVATGRTPNVEGLNLEAAGIEMDGRFIKVTDKLRTTAKNIFAIGDCTGGPQFTHVAGYHAGIIIRQMLFKMFWAKINYTALPWVTYTDPEVTQIGMTEVMARDKHGDDVTVTTWPFEDNDRTRAERKPTGIVKVITRKNGKILGAAMCGHNAGELIQVWGLAISQGLKMGAMAGYIAPYPTMGELNKRTAGSFFTEKLYSDTTKKIVRFLLKF